MRILTSFVLCLTLLPLVRGDCMVLGTENYEYRLPDDNNGTGCVSQGLSCVKFTLATANLPRIECNLFEGDDILSLLHDLYSQDNYDIDQFCVVRIDNLGREETSLLFPHGKTSSYLSSKLCKLHYSENEISKINASFFSGLTALEDLDLSRNLITSLEEDTFSSLSQLQKLNISRNQLKTVSRAVFSNLLDLFVIDLSFNNISYVPQDVFIKQDYLQLVLLNNNKIKSFDVDFQNNRAPAPSFIDLRFNIIEILRWPEYFSEVSLSYNNIVNFSAVVTNSAKSLNLSHNQITSIGPSAFESAKNLRIIDVGYNVLTMFPTGSFKNLTNLEYLDISNNIFSDNKHGAENNWVSFFLYLEGLKSVALDENDWRCSDLKDIINVLRSHGTKINRGNEHTSSNVIGISCRDFSNTSQEIMYDQSQIREKINKLQHNLIDINNTVQDIIIKLNMGNFSSLEEKISDLINKVGFASTSTNNKDINTADLLKLHIVDTKVQSPGVIIINVFLFIATSCLIFIAYLCYKKNKIRPHSRENINLV